MRDLASPTIELPTADLQQVLRNATAMVAKRPTHGLIIMGYVLIELTPGEPARFTVNDYESCLQQHVPVDYNGDPVRAAVGAHLLAQSLRLHHAAATDRSTLTFEGTILTVRQGGLSTRLPGLPPEDFPPTPAEQGPQLHLPGEDLASIATRTLVAVGRDDTLPVLTGVLLETTGGHLAAAATDRYRLAVVEMDHADETSDPVLIPGRYLQHAARLFRRAPQVDIGVHAKATNTATFAAGGVSLTVRTLEGTFPDYSRLLPGPSAPRETATLDKAQLQRALHHVRNCLPGTTPARLRFDLDRLQVLTPVESDTPSASADVAEVSYTGVPFEVAFNPLYLLDGLRAIPDEKVTVDFVGTTDTEHAHKPAVISGGPGYRYLLMPVNLRG